MKGSNPQQMKKPNFFIIGAPKCGTTSLARWLSEHPNIYMSPVKEPHFFNRDGLYSTETLEEYETLFSQAGPEHIAIGEASTHYLYSREAVPRILDYNPGAKFIVCIRNPIEMAPSLHAERVWQGRETVKSFEEAWRLQEERKQGRYIPRALRKDPERLQYGAYCRLGEQLVRLYSHVPKERVLVLVLDDIAENSLQEYKRILAFLDVPYAGRAEFPVYNRRKSVRSAYFSYALTFIATIKRYLGVKKAFGIRRWVQKHINEPRRPREGLPSEFRAELAAYFEDDVCLLEQLLGRNFSRWLR